MRGERREGAYLLEDESLAEKAEKDSDTIQATRKLIQDLFGDKTISQMAAADFTRFNDTVRLLPSSHGKSCYDRERTCHEIIRRAEEKADRERRKAEIQIRKEELDGDDAEALREKARLKRIAPKTFQRHQGNLNTAMNHAVAQGVISHNPFQQFVVGEKLIEELRQARPDTSRKLWHSELQDMLATEKWNSDKTLIDDPIYWLPLIAVLHGLRSEEILQLKPENIRNYKGIFYFDIERGTGQSAKSNNARRLVPIHSQLIELGFLELVARQRRLKKSRIFAKVNRSKTKKATFTANFTKNFKYYRVTHDVYDERMDFHALRTTCNTAMVTSSTPDTARRYLMGHKNPDVGIINYLPEGFPLETLQRYIEQEQLDLSMITTNFAKSNSETKGPYLVVENGVEVLGRRAS